LYPILFQFPGFTFYTQTLCIILAFVAGLLLAQREGQRFGITRLDLADIVLWAFLAAIPGARLMFLILNWRTATFTFSEFCTLGTLDGGFSLHGGLATGGLVGVLIARQCHVSVWRVADALAVGLAAAMFFLRLGCLFNGCDYGVVTTMPWGIMLHGASRHPIQLYEGVGNLLLVPLIVKCNQKPLKPGTAFMLYLSLSSLLRLGVDVYRDDPLRVWGVFTIPQLIALGLAILAGGWQLQGFFLRRIRKRGF